MSTTASPSLWETYAHTPTKRQRDFIRYLSATLVDLVVLGLFAEFWDHVTVQSFIVMLLAAALLQILLKLTIFLEHRLADYFNAKQGGFAKFMRFFSAWAVLFGSKFVILEALTFAFGERLRFSGHFNGIVALIVVVMTMLAVEVAIVKLYRRMG